MGKSFVLSDPQVVNLWEEMFEVEAKAKSVLLDDEYGLAGAGKNKLVTLRDELNKKPGAYITTEFGYQVSNRGRGGTEQLKGWEGDHETATDNIYVHVLRNAQKVDNPMYQQFTQTDLLDHARGLLTDWASVRLSFGLHAHAAGIALVTDPVYNLHNTITAMNSNYIIRPNSKAAGALTSGDRFDIDVLNMVAQFVKVKRPKMRPASTPWGDLFVLLLHPDQVRSLRESDSIWYGQMLASLQGGRIEDNPIFKNVLGHQQGILFVEDDLVPPGMNSGETAFKANTRRAWLGGAGALTLASAKGYRENPGFEPKKWRFLTDSDDYEAEKAVAVETICGAKRMRYTKPSTSTVHEGTLVIETYADPLLSTSDAYADWTDAAPGSSIEA